MFHAWIYGPIHQGYWLDPGRTGVCGGKPTPEQKHMTEALVDIIDRLMSEIRPDVKVMDVALLGDRLMSESGYASEVLKTNWPYYGHGNGCMWERPYIEPRLCTDEEVFEENMVASVEGFFDRDGVGSAQERGSGCLDGSTPPTAPRHHRRVRDRCSGRTPRRLGSLPA